MDGGLRARQGGEATLVAEVQLGFGKGMLNTLLGDWTGWLSLAGLVFFAIFMPITLRKESLS